MPQIHICMCIWIRPGTLMIVRVHSSFYFIFMEYQGYFVTNTDFILFFMFFTLSCFLLLWILFCSVEKKKYIYILNDPDDNFFSHDTPSCVTDSTGNLLHVYFLSMHLHRNIVYIYIYIYIFCIYFLFL